MVNYFKAEVLKFRHSLFYKLILWIPVMVIAASLALLYIGMGLGGFAGLLVCNWCMPMASVTVALLCHLVNDKEKKQEYRTLYSLPIDFRKTFLAKSGLVAGNLLAISMVLALVSIAAEGIRPGHPLSFGKAWFMILGYGSLWISLLWQIPFCHFWERKTGFIGSVLISLFANGIGGVFFALTPLFWVFPHSFPARLMMTLFGIQPSGMPVQQGAGYLMGVGDTLLLLVAALGGFFLLLVLSAHSCGREAEQ